VTRREERDRLGIETGDPVGYGSGMDYVDVEEGWRADGLRLVLTAGGPGPWSEAAKAVFHVKGLAWTPVRQNAG
jgi:hypothetical protein